MTSFDLDSPYTLSGTSEFLSLSKAEFNQALRSHWERDCNMRFDFMRACPHFEAWTDRQLQVCADSSELREYKNNTVRLYNYQNRSLNMPFMYM